MNDIETLIRWIKESNSTVFFGGAGVSTESGLKDFRSKDGLYNEKYDYPPEEILSHHFFLNNTYFVVTRDNYQGIIDINNSVSVSLSYDQLGIIKDNYLIGYTLNSIIAKKNGLYGIISIKDGSVIEEFNYKEEGLEMLLDILDNGEDYISN